MITTKKVVDFEDQQKVKEYLNKYRNLLCEELPECVLMSFVGVLYEATGKENIVNRKTAIDYLGFTGFDIGELKRVTENDEEGSLRKIANDWLSNRERQMIRYLCINEEKNRFGRTDEIIRDHFVESVVVSIIGKGYKNEQRIIYLTGIQRVNLGFNSKSFRFVGLQKPCNSLGKIYLRYRDKEAEAECCRADPLIDSFHGCGIRISKSLADHLSLKVSSKFELSTKPSNERFYV